VPHFLIDVAKQRLSCFFYYIRNHLRDDIAVHKLERLASPLPVRGVRWRKSKYCLRIYPASEHNFSDWALRFRQAISMYSQPILLIPTLLSTAAANPYTVTAYLPDHTVNGQIINAGGERLFLSLSYVVSYFPSTHVPTRACPSGNLTLFAGGLSMW
jgi:hypothetical protein